MKFDIQANIYDSRTGLGENIASKIATALEELIKPYSDGIFLDIGAGTGEIGFYLQNLEIPYVGIDLSAGMLDIYRKRFKEQSHHPTLIQTDGNIPWPLDDTSVSVFFSSRAMHQLNRKHVINELKRLSIPHGSILILGNIKRSQNSAKTVMRREMHQILNEFGLKEKSGQSNRKKLFETLEKEGGERLEPITVASWLSSHAPIESINSWKIVDGIAGQEINTHLKRQILDKLEIRMQQLFPDPNQPVEAEESYELNVIKLP